MLSQHQLRLMIFLQMHMGIMIMQIWSRPQWATHWFTYTAQWWGLLNQYSLFRYFPIFQTDQNTGYLHDITPIFGRCHRSWAAETPDKYERGWKYLNYAFFCKIKISRYGEINEQSFSNPHPRTNGNRIILQHWLKYMYIKQMRTLEPVHKTNEDFGAST